MQSDDAMREWSRRQVLMAVSWTGGWLGFDRFYQRQPLWGVLKLVTLGGIGVWWLADAIYYTVQAGKT